METTKGRGISIAIDVWIPNSFDLLLDASALTSSREVALSLIAWGIRGQGAWKMTLSSSCCLKTPRTIKMLL